MRVSEKEIQRILAEEYVRRGYVVRREIVVSSGIIDLIVQIPIQVGHECIYRSVMIEVKDIRSIKHAIGQIMSYRRYYPCDEYWVVYFDRRCEREYINAEKYTGIDTNWIKIKSIYEEVSREQLNKVYIENSSSNSNIQSNKESSISCHASSISMTRVDMREDQYPSERDWISW